MSATKRTKGKSRSQKGTGDHLPQDTAEDRPVLTAADQTEQMPTVATTVSEFGPTTENLGERTGLVREEMMPVPPAPDAAEIRSLDRKNVVPEVLESHEGALMDNTAGAITVEEKASVPKEIQLVCFRIGKEEYGVDINSLQEINRVPDIVGIPDVPPYVKGIINLRGRIIPIIDVRLLLGLPPVEYGGKTRIIVLNHGHKLTGLVVDDVTQVIRAARSALVKPPGLTTSLGREFLAGIYRGEDSMILIIDCERVLDKYDQNRGATP